ncbi:MAG: putative Fe-S cluster protein YjdI, partial [Polaribacter sp.]
NCSMLQFVLVLYHRYTTQKISPWIASENARTEELKNQIGKCPSGALSYSENM